MSWVHKTLIWMLLATCWASSNTADNNPGEDSLSKMIDDMINQYKREVKQVLNVRSHRMRRESNQHALESYNISSVTLDPNLRLPSSKCHALFHYMEETFVFSCGTAGSNSILYNWTPSNGLVEVSSLQFEFNIIKIEAEVYRGQLYVAVVQEFGPMYIYRLVAGVGRNGLSIRFLDRIQTIKPYGLPSSALLYQFREKLWLILVNEGFQGLMSKSVKTTSAIYEWNGAHFDEVYTFETTGAMAVEICEVESTLYIGIAQFQDDNGNYQIGSPIYRFNPVQNRFEKFQILRTNGARDIVHFHHDRRNYLAIANEKGISAIYWWAGDQFLEWQFLPQETNMPFEGSSMFKAIALPNNYQNVLMLVQNNQLLFFIDNEEGVFRFEDVSVNVDSNGKISDATLFRSHDKYWIILAVDGSDGSQVYELVLRPVKERQPIEKNPLLSCLGYLEKDVRTREEALALASEQLPNVWVKNGDQTIKATVVVNGDVSSNGMMSLGSGLITTDGEVRDITPGSVRRATDDVFDQASRLASDFDTVVTKTGDQVIYGEKSFFTDIRIDTGSISRIVNDVSINGQLFSNLAFNTLKYSGDQTFLQPVHFKDVEATTVTLDGQLNDIDISELMLTRGDQVVTGQHQLSKMNVRGDIDTETINKIMLDTIVTIDTEQTISGRKIFDNLNVDGNIFVESTVNEEDLSEFAKHAMLITGDQELYSTLTFAGDLTIDSDVEIAGTVNGINVTDLKRNAVFFDTDQTIYGRTVFETDVTIGNVELDGLLNGVDITKDLFTTSTDQTYTGALTFGDVIVRGDVHVGRVNGIPLNEMAVRVNGEEDIQGLKTFEGTLTVDGNIDMEEGATISDIDISEIEYELVQEHGTATLVGRKTFPSLSVTSLNVDSVNGQSLDNLDNLFWRKSVPQTIGVDVTIKGNVEFASPVSALAVNGFDLAKDFVHTFGEETISAPVHFDQLTVLGDVIATGTLINGLDINDINDRAVRKRGNYDISGKKTFASDLNVAGHIHSPNVNGRSLNDLMQTNKNQKLKGPVRFKVPVYVGGNLIADNIDIDDTINKIDLDKLKDRIVYKDKNATIHGLKVFNELEIGELNVKNIDGIDIESLFEKAMTLSSDQEITGNIEFKSNVDFESILHVDRLNGIDLKDHLNRVVRRNVDQIVTGFKQFSSPVEIKGSLDANTVNGRSLVDLMKTSLLRSPEQLVTGKYTFNNDVTIDVLEVDEDNTLDTKLVSKLAFVDRDTTFLSDVTFQNGVEMSDVTVLELVNGCDLNELMNQAVYKKGDQVLTGSNVVNELEVERSAVVSGLLNGVDVARLAASVVTVDGDQEIYGKTVFDADIDASSIDVGTLNGIDVDAFYADAVLNSAEQTIEGPKEFVNGLNVNELLEIGGKLEVDAVNGVDIRHLAAHLVTTTRDHVIEGRKTFQHVVLARELNLEGNLNDISIPEGLVRIDVDSLIPKMTIFNQGFATDNLVVDRLLDGVNIGDVIDRRVTLSTDQTISGDFTFQGPVYIKGDVGYVNTINEIPLSSLVLANVPQVVRGSKTFANLAVDGDAIVLGFVNNYNLTIEEKRIVRVDRPAEILGKMIFEGEVTTTGNMDVIGLVDGINVEDLPYLLRNTMDGGLESIGHLNNSLMDVQNRLREADGLSKSLFSLVQYLEVDSEIQAPVTSLLKLQAGVAMPTFVWTEGVVEEWNCRVTKSFPGVGLSLPLADGSRASIRSEKESIKLSKLVVDKDRRCALNIGSEFEISRSHLVQEPTVIAKMKLFTSVSGDVYAVYLSEGSLLVSRLIGGSEWELIQEFDPALSCSDFDTMLIESSLLLATANNYDEKNESSSTYSNVYAWNEAREQFILTQSFLTDGASAIALYPEREMAYLLIGQSKGRSYSESSRRLGSYPSQVFKFDSTTGLFTFLRNLHDLRSVSAFDVFELVGDVWIGAASHEEGTINLMKWKGGAGFVSVLRIPLVGVQDIQTVVMEGEPKLAATLDSGTTVLLAFRINGPKQLW